MSTETIVSPSRRLGIDAVLPTRTWQRATRLFIAVAAAALLVACGANARTVALKTAIATETVTKAALEAYTAQHEMDIANRAPSLEVGETQLNQYEKKLHVVDDALNALLLAISAAAVANDEASLAAIAPAALKLEQAFEQLKSDATGGK